MKVCKKCNIKKIFEDFHKTPKSRFTYDGYLGVCKLCRSDYNRNYHIINKKDLNEHRQKYRKENKEFYSSQKVAHDKTYRLKNKDKLSKKQLMRRKTNVTVKLAHKLSSRLRVALKNNKRANSLVDIIGTDINTIKKYFESMFITGMSWDNYGLYGWHIDHIRPCASFDLSDPEQQKECFHYTNLQPLWAKDNLKKGAKYDNQMLAEIQKINKV